MAALAAAACESSSPEITPATPPSAAPLDCASGDAGDWSMYGGNVCNTRADSVTDPITPETISRLTLKWKFDAGGDISATPAVVGGQVYVPDWGGKLTRLDGQTGQTVWSRSIADILGDSDAGSDASVQGPADGGSDAAAQVPADGASEAAAQSPADAALTSPADAALQSPADAGSDASAPVDADTGDADQSAGAGDAGVGDAAVANALPAAPTLVGRGTPVVTNGLVVFGLAPQLYGGGPVGTSSFIVAVDQNSGAHVWTTELDPHPFAVITSSPILDNGRIYVGVSSGEEGAALSIANYPCCTFRGSVAALDAVTGKVLWQTPMIEDSAYRNADGSLSGFAGAAVWSSPTVDRKRRLLYVTTGNNYSTPPAWEDAGAPLPAGDHIESIVALDLDTGAIRWSRQMTKGDIWTFIRFGAKDYDFGCSANLFQATIDGGVRDVVGAGQKSGVYSAVDADTGAILWQTQVGPGGHLGGIHWGTATDGKRVYVGVNDESGTPYMLGGAGEQAGRATAVGSWAALDPATGATLWQVANPAMTAPLAGASVNGPVSAVNGVLFAGSMDADGMMYALDAASGKTLWSFPSGATVYGGAAIANGVVYWGNGYPSGRLGFGTPGHTLYAFGLAP